MRAVTLPSFPVSGGCQCGAVRYSLKAPPVVFYLCHCTECQKQSSSAFGESVKVRAEDVTVSGMVGFFEREGSRGTIRCEFCPVCSTRLFHRHRDSCNIKGGTFDDTQWLIPAGHIWTESKQPFISIGADEISYPHGPESYEPMKERWREMAGLAGEPA